MSKISFNIPLSVPDSNGDVIMPGAFKDGLHNDMKGNMMELKHEECGCGYGKIKAVIFLPTNKGEYVVTEDAEFEVVEPKQITNG